MNEKTRFYNIESEKIKNCFFKALNYFPELQERRISVYKRSTGGATMNARPEFDFHFFSKKKRGFAIGVSSVVKVDNVTPIIEVPEDVLIGWFCHELGHLIDYLKRSGWNLLRFGLFYTTSESFRVGAERRADIFAIGHGCADYVLATKKYILEHSDLSNEYKTRIERYYLSPEELALMIQENGKGRLDEVQFLERKK